MNIRYQCLPCLVNQAIRVAELTNASDRDELFRKVFSYMSQLDFSRTNPEVVGAVFRMLKQHIGADDPYRDTRHYYNSMLMEQEPSFETAIAGAIDPFLQAIRFSILGNIIDFGPMHNTTMDDVRLVFAQQGASPLTIDHSAALRNDISRAKTLLYLGDNCGEIVLDKLLIKQIHQLNPDLTIWFGVRGTPVVNDSIAEDAYSVEIDRYARIISNGDDSLGTVLDRCSPEFREVFDRADVIIAKGQANYESLSEIRSRNIYLLLMTKCSVIAGDIGVPTGSLVCMQNA